MENEFASPLFESHTIWRNNQGLQTQARILRFNRYQAAFEIYSPSVDLRMSEALDDFKIVLSGRTVYSGRAVVSGLVNTGPVLVCEVTLDEGWIDVQPLLPNGQNHLRGEFEEFMRRWQKNYKVRPEFKVVVADMQSLLSDMRLWLEQLELAIHSPSNGEGTVTEADAAHELAAPILSTIDALGDRFEEIAGQLEPEARGIHLHFTRRQLHPLLLCSPFAYRTFTKPLGYAGDYEMVNMIMRNPYEGGSLFARVINAWFLNQLPAQAHRNRIQFLKDKLVEQAARMARSRRPARIFNLGAGPAREIQEFLVEKAICDNTQFTLLDFNEETIRHASGILQESAKRLGRRTSIQVQKKSVQQLLKEAVRPGPSAVEGKYDFVYCAGLFDYLPDRVCKQLVGLFYERLAPGGLLLVTNVDGTRPFHNKLEFILDWNLIYRNGRQMLSLKPDQASPDACSVKSDLTAVNLFMEIQKPANA